MNVTVLDTLYQAIAVIDACESLIWTDRYQKYGDFELYTGMGSQFLKYMKDGYYLVSNESEHAMIVETKEIETDSETGNHVKVSGRSLESILLRRIVWSQTTISGNLQNGIKRLITDAIILPSIPARKIDNFVFKDSTDPAITKLSVEAQFTGDNLYDAIVSLCEPNDLGFKVTLNEANQLVFELYKGADRSFAQMSNPFVIFSPKFDNIVGSNYLESTSNYKNVSLIGGEGEGSDRTFAVADLASAIGLARREMFTDARDLSTDNGDTKISASEYQAQLIERGNSDLAENKKELSFDGEVEAYDPFYYGKDFFMGDIVQISNEYGIEGAARVTEFIHSYSNIGPKCYPTFTVIEEE